MVDLRQSISNLYWAQHFREFFAWWDSKHDKTNRHIHVSQQRVYLNLRWVWNAKDALSITLLCDLGRRSESFSNII